MRGIHGDPPSVQPRMTSAQALAARLRTTPCKRALLPCTRVLMPDGTPEVAEEGAGGAAPAKVMRVGVPVAVAGPGFGFRAPIVSAPAVVQQLTYPCRRWTLGFDAAGKVVGLTMLDLFGAGPGSGPWSPEWGLHRVVHLYLIDGGDGLAALALRLRPDAPVAVTVHGVTHTQLASTALPPFSGFGAGTGAAAAAAAPVLDMALPVSVAQAGALKQGSSTRVENRCSCLLIGPGTGACFGSDKDCRRRKLVMLVCRVVCAHSGRQGALFGGRWRDCGPAGASGEGEVVHCGWRCTLLCAAARGGTSHGPLHGQRVRERDCNGGACNDDGDRRGGNGGAGAGHAHRPGPSCWCLSSLGPHEFGQ